MLDIRLKKVFMKLQPEDAVKIMLYLASYNHQCLRELPVGDWARVNKHNVKANELKCFLAFYTSQNIITERYSEEFIDTLSRFFKNKYEMLDADVIWMTMTYLRKARIRRTEICDIAARHFVENSADYKDFQMCSMAFTFGYLNYLPANTRDFYVELEKRLDGKYSAMILV